MGDDVCVGQFDAGRSSVAPGRDHGQRPGKHRQFESERVQPASRRLRRRNPHAAGSITDTNSARANTDADPASRGYADTDTHAYTRRNPAARINNNVRRYLMENPDPEGKR